MNRLSWEITKRTYTMDLDFDHLAELTEQEQKDWKDMWMFNNIFMAIRKPIKEE